MNSSKVKSLSIAVIFIILNSITLAQKIYVCESVTDIGIPIDAKPGWELNDDGTDLVILFDNGSKPIRSNLLYLFIDKQRGDSFEPFDSKVIQIENEPTWISYEYTFISDGVYKVYFMDATNKKLAFYQVTIYKVEDMDDVIVKNLRPRYFSSNYYSDLLLTYCQKVVADKPMNKRNYTSLEKDAGEIYVHLNNYKPMQTDTIIVEIWFKEQDWDNYSEFVETKKFKLDGNWPNTFFRYVFDKTGQFKFEIFDQRNELIVSTPPVTVYE